MSKTFVNPLLVHGADPWMYKHEDGSYYFMVTRRNRLDLWRSDNITNIANGDKKTIWIPEETGINSNNLWAPEIHYINKKWYVYYTANDGGGDSTRKIFVLENEEEDPFEGTWTDKGFINTEYAGLDGTVFEHMGSLFPICRIWPFSGVWVCNLYGKNDQSLDIRRRKRPAKCTNGPLGIARWYGD